MATKQHRGKTLWNLTSHGRGTCPVCKTTRIKILYSLTTEDGSKLTVCKRCQHKKVASVS